MSAEPVFEEPVAVEPLFASGHRDQIPVTPSCGCGHGGEYEGHGLDQVQTRVNGRYAAASSPAANHNLEAEGVGCMCQYSSGLYMVESQPVNSNQDFSRYYHQDPNTGFHGNQAFHSQLQNPLYSMTSYNPNPNITLMDPYAFEFVYQHADVESLRYEQVLGSRRGIGGGNGSYIGTGIGYQDMGPSVGQYTIDDSRADGGPYLCSTNVQYRFGGAYSGGAYAVYGGSGYGVQARQ